MGAVPGTDPYTRTCKRSSSLPPTIRGPGPEGPPSGEAADVAKAGVRQLDLPEKPALRHHVSVEGRSYLIRFVDAHP